MTEPSRAMADPTARAVARRGRLGPSSIPSLGDGVMLGAAWIDRPVDARGCTPASTSSLVQHGSAAMLKPMIDIPLASLRCPPEALRPETADTVAAT